MSDDEEWGNQQCNCTSARAFPHRRKKCSLGFGKRPKPKSDGKPALSERLGNAAQDGLVAGTAAGVAMGTAVIIRNAMQNTVGAVVESATDSFKSSLKK